MKRISKILALAVASLMAVSVSAQNNCLDFHKTKCPSANTTGYHMSNDSRSATMRKGQSSEFRITIYQGKDYRISVCSDESALGSTVHMRLIDYETEELLYGRPELKELVFQHVVFGAGESTCTLANMEDSDTGTETNPNPEEDNDI